jgi:hypothetical protein
MKKPSFSLPEPEVFKEIHAIHLRMNRKARSHGWEVYLSEVNQRAGHLLGKSLAHSLKPPMRPGGLRSLGQPSDGQDARRAVKTFPSAEG